MTKLLRKWDILSSICMKHMGTNECVFWMGCEKDGGESSSRPPSGHVVVYNLSVKMALNLELGTIPSGTKKEIKEIDLFCQPRI